MSKEDVYCLIEIFASHYGLEVFDGTNALLAREVESIADAFVRDSFRGRHGLFKFAARVVSSLHFHRSIDSVESPRFLPMTANLRDFVRIYESERGVSFGFG